LGKEQAEADSGNEGKGNMDEQKAVLEDRHF
jgi:hypothetical protein